MYEIWASNENGDHYYGVVPNEDIANTTIKVLNAFSILEKQNNTFFYLKQHLVNLDNLLKDIDNQFVCVLGYKSAGKIHVTWELRAMKKALEEYPIGGKLLDENSIKFSISPRRALDKSAAEWKKYLEHVTSLLLEREFYRIEKHYKNGTVSIQFSYKTKKLAEEMVVVLKSIDIFSTYNPIGEYKIVKVKGDNLSSLTPEKLKKDYYENYKLEVGVTEYNDEWELSSYQLLPILSNKLSPEIGKTFTTNTGTRVIDFSIKLDNQLYGLSLKEFEEYLIAYAKKLVQSM